MDLSGLFNKDSGLAPFSTGYHQALSTMLEPMTKIADAQSKLTYASLMQPQYLAKLFGNENILAGLTDEQKETIKDRVLAGGGGGGGLGVGQILVDSLVNWWKGNAHNPPGAQPTTPARAVPANAGYSYDSQGNNIVASPAEVAKAAAPPAVEPQSATAADQAFAANETPAEREARNRSQRAGVTKAAQELALPSAMTSQPAEQGTMIGEPPPANPPEQKTWAERVAQYKGNVKQGEKEGELRAEEAAKLDDVYQNSLQKETTLNHLGSLLTNPIARDIRTLGIGGKQEVAALAAAGTPEQQNWIGQFRSDTNNVIKDGAQDFKGQFRVGEQQLLENAKVSDKDTIDVALGKAESAMYLTTMMANRSHLAAQYMRAPYHMNKGDALALADRQVNGAVLRQQIHDKLNPYVTLANPNNPNQTITMRVEEARAKKVKGV